MNDAADLLPRHAQQVRERNAWIHSMVDQIKNQAQEAWDGATHAAGDAFEWREDKAESALNKVKSWL